MNTLSHTLPLMTSRRYTPITDASAWKSKEMQDSKEWLYHFTKEDIADIDHALVQWHKRGLTREQMQKSDFYLPNMAATLDTMAKDVESGRGFFLLRGLPLERWSSEDANLAYWGLSLYLGQPTSQNAAGDTLVSVADGGIPKTDINWRAYYGNAQLHFHSDFTDVVGLMCIRPAKRGGVS